MKFRLLLLTYFTAFAAGAVFKYIQYLINPENVSDLNTTVVELTFVSVVVTGLVAIFYMYKANQKKKNAD
ncbi:hypothetical protein BH23BAC3_BH23BAC3_15690 [soil metagenome]